MDDPSNSMAMSKFIPLLWSPDQGRAVTVAVTDTKVVSGSPGKVMVVKIVFVASIVSNTVDLRLAVTVFVVYTRVSQPVSQRGICIVWLTVLGVCMHEHAVLNAALPFFDSSADADFHCWSLLCCLLAACLRIAAGTVTVATVEVTVSVVDSVNVLGIVTVVDSVMTTVLRGVTNDLWSVVDKRATMFGTITGCSCGEERHWVLRAAKGLSWLVICKRRQKIAWMPLADCRGLVICAVCVDGSSS